MNNLTSFNEAIKIIKENTKILKEETISIHDSLNRVISSDIKATITNPSFNNSAVDGIGVTKKTLLNLQKKNRSLLIKKTILAGDRVDTELEIKDNECLHIMTGAIVPKCISTIFFIEDTVINNNAVFIKAELKDNQNIRYAGEDFKKDDILLEKSTKIKFNNIAVMAASGIAKVKVFNNPKVTIFTTGKETIEVGSEISTGKIYNSNILTMKTFLESLGFETIILKNVDDNMDALKSNIVEAQKLSVDIIISSGAVSMGVEDIIKQYLLDNEKILYNNLKIRPGKPNMLALLKNNILYFALPGNPVSTAVGLYFFVQAYYNFANDIFQENNKKAILEHDYTKKNGFTIFFRGESFIENGKLKVKILDNQGSHMLLSLSKANCFVKIDEDKTNILKNTIVDIYEIK